jgi:transcriptional regulator with XRE-family HTH domain
MNIAIAEKLKHLRIMKGLTQEELAGFLDVSFQAVSKWERGECFPDITMLPGLANFFDVSIDELMGMNDIRNQERLNEIFRCIHEYEAENRYDEAVELLRHAVKTFPNHYGLISELALALSFSIPNDPKEAIALSESVLENSTSEKIRSTVRANLCFLYKRSGDQNKAMDLVRTLPHVWESREMLRVELLEGQSYVETLKKSICIILSVLNEKIDALQVSEKVVSQSQKIVALGACEKGITDMPVILHKIADFLNQ